MKPRLKSRVGLLDGSRNQRWRSSVKTTESGGPRGFDAGKKIKGRKRHIVTDTQGNLLSTIVHPGNVQDRFAGGDVVPGPKTSACTPRN